MLLLRLLGSPSLCGNGSTLTGPATQRHRLALLALLASSRSRPQSRSKSQYVSPLDIATVQLGLGQ
jgi:DNA-binding SARP family transcriptional activator